MLALQRRVGSNLAHLQAVSAGLAPRSGAPLTREARQALLELDVAPADHAARSVTADLVARAELILCLTDEQRRRLVAEFPEVDSRTHRLDPVADIEDPSGSPPEQYLQVARRIRDKVRWQLQDKLALPVGDH